MDKLISFELVQSGVETYTVKNLEINPNLGYFDHSLKHNNKNYRIKINIGYIIVYRVWLCGDEELLFIFERSSSHHESRCELIKELLSLSKDKMQEYANKVKERMNKVQDWEKQRKVKSFKI